MSTNKLRILLLSSRPLNHSAGYAADMKKALELNGHEVDFITNDFDPPEKESGVRALLTKLRVKYKCVNNAVAFINRFRKNRFRYTMLNSIQITQPDESIPPVPTETILAKITKPYDLVITQFWEDMISAITLRDIYAKLKCPIFIKSVDMAPFTGGCFYFMDCRNFRHECGCCPGLGSNDRNDQSHKNYLIKKEIYSSINCAILCNTWMSRFVRETKLFRDAQIITSTIVIDETRFVPRNRQQARSNLNIPAEKEFIFFCRYAGLRDKRKGMKELMEALQILHDRMTPEQRQKTLLLLAGEAFHNEDKSLKFDYMSVGKLNLDGLIDAYNASTVFLSPSIDDAGPSMVNQSILCGTPAVTYSIGTALDVIHSGHTGYKARNFLPEDYAQGIKSIIDLDAEAYAALRERCRNKALEFHSLKAMGDFIECAYQNIIGE